MAEDTPKSSGKSGKSASSSSTSRGASGLAAIQGENAADPRPTDEQPGTPEHLGSDRPYEGGDSPLVEGDADARNR